MTEALRLTSISGAAQLGAVGVPVAWCDVHIAAEDGSTLAAGEGGETATQRIRNVTLPSTTKGCEERYHHRSSQI